MALLQLTAVQRQANIVEDINNVFYFETDDPPNSNSDLLEFIDEWIAVVQPAILAFQSDQIVYLEVNALEVNGVFFATRSQGAVDGLISCDAMNPYMAYEFIYNRATRTTRNGYKRFAGVCEDAVDQGGNVTGAVATALTTAEGSLAVSLTLSWAIATPVIFGRATPPPSSLPERVNQIQSVTFLRVTTQNSRKPWR